MIAAVKAAAATKGHARSHESRDSSVAVTGGDVDAGEAEDATTETYLQPRRQVAALAQAVRCGSRPTARCARTPGGRTRLNEPAKALDLLVPLLKMAYYLLAVWLKTDPAFDSLRRNPRFQVLLGGTA